MGLSPGPAETAGIADAEPISELAANSIPGSWSARAFSEQLAHPDTRAWLVRDSGFLDGGFSPLLGVLVARVIGAEFEILSFAVAPHCRRRGIGRTLLEALLGEASESGADVVHLELRASNRAAKALYSGHGFEFVGTRRGYYRDGEDALLMSLRVDPAQTGSGL